MHAQLSPLSITNGEQLTVELSEVPTELVGEIIEIQLASVDAIETAWAASMSETVSSDRRWVKSFEPTRTGETVFTLARVALKDPQGNEVQDLTNELAGSAVLNPGRSVDGPEDVQAVHDALVEQQQNRYSAGLGDPEDSRALEHRALCLVERLLMTTRLRIPGVVVAPVASTGKGRDEAEQIQLLLEELGWTARMKADWWEEVSGRARPWTAILISPIWAAGLEEAAGLAWEERDRLLDIFSVTRGASGRPVATVIEQRTGETEQTGREKVNFRVHHEDQHYGGNLLGGFASGEDQRSLLHFDASLREDRLLRLCVGLYRSARGEADVDAQYFRFWSVLETLAGARIPDGRPVTLLDGHQWPGQHATTDFAAPRVYQLLASGFGNVNEASVVAPAQSLDEAVRCWYARRNATAHYGRFVENDPAQRSKHWHGHAARTLTRPSEYPAEGGDPWLRALRDVTAGALTRDMTAVGEGAVA